MPAPRSRIFLDSVVWRGAPSLPLLHSVQGSAVMPLPMQMRSPPVVCSGSGQAASRPAGRLGPRRNLLNPDAPAWYPLGYSDSVSELRTAVGARVPAGVASLQDDVGIPPFAQTPAVDPTTLSSCPLSASSPWPTLRQRSVVGARVPAGLAPLRSLRTAHAMGFAAGSDVAASPGSVEDDSSDEESRPPTPDSIADLLPELQEYRSYLAWLTHRRVIVYKYVAERRRLARLGLVRTSTDLFATICTLSSSPLPAPRCPE